MSEQDRGQFVEMEQPCVDCKQVWGMYESEIAFYENLIQTKHYTMPKRCPDCRKKKREQKLTKGGQAVDLRSLADRLSTMAKNAEEQAYDFHEELLASELREVAEQIRMYMRRGKKEKNEQAQPTESVS